jgi:hypothetical protein
MRRITPNVSTDAEIEQALFEGCEGEGCDAFLQKYTFKWVDLISADWGMASQVCNDYGIGVCG